MTNLDLAAVRTSVLKNHWLPEALRSGNDDLADAITDELLRRREEGESK